MDEGRIRRDPESQRDHADHARERNGELPEDGNAVVSARKTDPARKLRGDGQWKRRQAAAASYGLLSVGRVVLYLGMAIHSTPP